ncbi:MAG: hypothetical protein JNM56_27975 [Planctomycetia bacterium]|nr:hypothetical protein [Planctomycetia bacterium]
MSTTLLRLIPREATFVPTIEAQKRAKRLVAASLPAGTKVSIRVEDKVIFVDAGSYTESVHCPYCKRKLSDEWWAEAMDRAYQTQFTNLNAKSPCCKKNTSLNELRYTWPAGFARFTLEAVDPNISELDPQLVTKLEEALGCAVRVVWTRY